MRAAVLFVPLVLLAPAPMTQAPMPGRTEAPPVTVHKIILVGDSTVAPNSGWGGAFCARHVKWSIACINLARGGRSTRSFRSEGAWDLALAEMEVEGYEKVYVLIQMGHNDQARDRPERWTAEATEFPDNLRRFVGEAREAGAVPILVTPLSRRDFRNGVLDNTLASWSEQVRKVARELDVPLIDLNARSARLLQEIGPVAAMALAQRPPTAAERTAAAGGTTLPPPPRPDAAPHAAGPGPRGDLRARFDYTHLGEEGARVFAAMIAEDFARRVPELAGEVVP
jgi:lysophospholipase L1-like esterase